jgi:hypothetical protein
MAFAVHFDDEATFEARKIHCHSPDRELLPELQSSRSLSKLLP